VKLTKKKATQWVAFLLEVHFSYCTQVSQIPEDATTIRFIDVGFISDSYHFFDLIAFHGHPVDVAENRVVGVKKNPAYQCRSGRRTTEIDSKFKAIAFTIQEFFLYQAWSDVGILAFRPEQQKLPKCHQL
jgi:hypothetical protein